MALAVPIMRRKEEGFSHCNGETRQELVAREHREPSSYFFHHDEDEHGKRLLQSERNAGLLIDVLRSLVAKREFTIHDFLIMPDHVHLLLTVYEGMTIEKAMQLVKGRFSHQLGKELGYKGEVWQRGFSEVQVLGEASFAQHRSYIANNPVKTGLVDVPENYPFCFESLARRKAEERRVATTQLITGAPESSRG
jgi:putative transposase